MSATLPRTAADCSCERSGPSVEAGAFGAKQTREVRADRKWMQGRDDFRGGGEPTIAILGQHPRQDHCQLLWDVRPPLADRRRRYLGMGLELLIRRRKVRGGEGRASLQQVVQRAAQTIDVRADIDRVAVVALLGGHVVERAEKLAGRRDLSFPTRIVHQPRQAQVEHLHLAGRREHQVGRLDVAVDQAVFMDVLQPEGRLPNYLASLRHG